MEIQGKRGLLIAEKPSLMRTIKNVYDNNKSEIPYSLDFVAQRGHLFTLKTPNELDEDLKSWNWEDLPIEPEKLGGWQYKIIKDKKQNSRFPTAKERFEEIKEKIHSGRYDFIINAGDPDQEGELLIRIVLDQAKNNLPVYRYWQNATTDEKVMESLLNLKNDESDPMLTNLLKAAYGRQHSDYRFGMNLSRALSMKMNARAAVGRVKTAIQSIVVNREDEINNFVPTTRYGVKSNYVDNFNGTLFNNNNVEDVNEEDSEKDKEKKSGTIWFDKKDEAQKLIDSLPKEGKVTLYEEKKAYTQPPKFFKLSTAQKEGAKLGYSPVEVKDAIQSLYEKQLVSYPRSDVEQISSTENLEGILSNILKFDFLNKFSSQINDEVIAKVRNTKKWVNDKLVETKGHTGIIPTTSSKDIESLNKQEKDIYQMICERFTAVFLPPMIENKIDMIVNVDNNTFKTNGKSLVDKGYTELLTSNHQDVIIPKYNVGDTIQVEEYNINESTTQKPTRFTTTDLISVCDAPHKYLDDESLKALGKRLTIGTPATTDGIIEGLIKRDKYLEVYDQGKRKDIVKPTKMGYTIIKNIEGMPITKVDMTGEWEYMLEEVRMGKRTLESLENEMSTTVESMINKIKNKNIQKVENSKNKFETIGTCPKCGGDLIKGPKSFFCSNYKEKGCRVGGFYKRNGAIVSTDEFLNMLNNNEVFEKNMEYKGRKYFQKVGVNEQGTIINFVETKETNLTCPNCGKNILESPKAFYCEGNKDKSCGVGISKNISGVEISKEEAKNLFTKGKTNVIKGFTSKKGTNYNAVFYYDNKEKKVNMKAMFPEEETNFNCPVCGKKLLRSKFTLNCEGNHDGSCKFKMFSQEYKKDMPDSKIHKLLDLVKAGKISGGEEAFITEKPVKTGYKCPKCQKDLLRKDSKFYCEDKKCKMEFYRNIMSDVMLDSDIEDLLTKGETRLFGPFTSKSGNPYYVKNILTDNDEVEMKFENKEVESSHKCPICGENLNKNGLKYACPSCHFDMFAMAGKKPLSDKDLNDLLTKGETRYMKMTFKNGNTYTAKIYINKDKKGTDLKFQNNKNS